MPVAHAGVKVADPMSFVERQALNPDAGRVVIGADQQFSPAAVLDEVRRKFRGYDGDPAGVLLAEAQLARESYGGSSSLRDLTIFLNDNGEHRQPISSVRW